MRRFVPFVLLSALLVACGGSGPGVLTSLSRPTPAASSTAAKGSPPTKVPPAATATPVRRRLFATAAAGTPLEQASKLVDAVALTDTTYDHNGSIVWPATGAKASSHTDCSGLINALLGRAYGVTAREFKAWLGTDRPLAKDYFQAIQDRRGFTPVATVGDLHPGDIIAVRYPNSAPGDDTGHVMLVVDAPKAHVASKPDVAGSKQWDVTVIDSADSGHGPADTRALPQGKSHEGLGRGVLRLYADDAGHLTGYTWSDLADSQFFAVTDRPIVAGRLDDQFSV